MTFDAEEKAARHRISVRLSILGSDRDYIAIDRIIGRKSKHFARKGMRTEGRPVAKKNVWSYWGDEPDEDSDFDTQWKAVDLLISEKKDELVELGKHADIQCSVVVHAFSGFPAFNLTKDAIERLASIGASLDVDLYGSLTDEVF